MLRQAVPQLAEEARLVLDGAVAGLLARGGEPAPAVVWASHVHAAAGDRLAVTVGSLEFLASELPRVLVELGDA